MVRSSAPGEDAEDISFAGLHESVVGVRGREALLEAVRIVWSSLWSDAALLYRRELGLDPSRSNMAVLVQELVIRDRSGVAFARDPRRPDREVMVVEAVPGLAGTWSTAPPIPTAGCCAATTARWWKSAWATGAKTGWPARS